MYYDDNYGNYMMSQVNKSNSTATPGPTPTPGPGGNAVSRLAPPPTVTAPTITSSTTSVDTDTTNYFGEKPTGEPIKYVEFPSGLRLPVYTLNQIPESERWKYANLVNSNDNTIMFVPAGMENAKVSEHFTVREFMADVAKKDPANITKDNPYGFCFNGNNVVKNGKERFIRLDPQLVKDLENIRSLNGNKAMIIGDGYRTVEFNTALMMVNPGAAKNTPHSAGIAADFKILGVNASTVQTTIANNLNTINPNGRIGCGGQNTHYDIGVPGRAQTWSYPIGVF